MRYHDTVEHSANGSTTTSATTWHPLHPLSRAMCDRNSLPLPPPPPPLPSPPSHNTSANQRTPSMLPPSAPSSHALDAWKINAVNLLKFLFFIGSGDARERDARNDGDGSSGAARTRAATEGCRALAGAAPARPRRPSEPACRPPPPPPPKARVRFNRQIRVILVASRRELSSVKGDVWWGEKDYCHFRCASTLSVCLFRYGWVWNA